MSASSFWNRPLVRVVVVTFTALFVAAPTPGNVGGCTNTSNAVVGNPANPGETNEWAFFDRGLCSGMCWRLRNCGVICSALAEAPTNPTCGMMGGACCAGSLCRAGLVCAGSGTCQPCTNDDTAPYVQCVRGGLNHSLFGANSCPHDCGSLNVGPYHQAYDFDVQACQDALQTLSCSATGSGSIGAVFQAGTLPPECVNVCY